MGIYEKALPSVDSWGEALDITRRTGYDFLEMSIDESDSRLARLSWDKSKRAEVRRAISDSGVPIRHLCLSGHRRFAFASADATLRKRAWEIMRRALDLCTDLGIRIIQTQGHDVYYEESTPETRNRYRDALSEAAELARGASVMLALENADLPLIGSLDQARDWIVECGNPWFQMYPDLGNSCGHGFDVLEELPRNMRHIVAVHIKDARPGEFRRVEFGEGNVPLRESFELLESLGYRGPLVIEMWNEKNKDPEQVVRNARTWVLDRMP